MQSICIISGEGDIGLYSIKKSLKSKLTWYLAGCVIVSGVVACFIGYMFFYFATNYVEQVFEDEAINQTWQIKYLDDLQEYVNKNGITSDTIKELKEWTDEF